MAHYLPIFALNRRVRRERVFKTRLLQDDLRDIEVVPNYRLNDQCISDLTDLLYDDLSSDTDRSHAVPVTTKVHNFVG